MRVSLLLVCAVAMIPGATASATAPISVSGTVRDAGGAVLAEVPVDLVALPSNYERSRQLLEGHDPEPVATTRTNAAGRFALAAPAAGVWTVRVRPAGCVPMRFAPLVLVRPTELPAVRVLRDAGATVDVRDPAGEPTLGKVPGAFLGGALFWEAHQGVTARHRDRRRRACSTPPAAAANCWPRTSPRKVSPSPRGENLRSMVRYSMYAGWLAAVVMGSGIAPEHDDP